MISDLSCVPIGQLAAAEAAYAFPPRAYHHFGHIRDVLARADEVAAGPGWRQPDEVRLAILYHDAVYEPRCRACHLVTDAPAGARGRRAGGA